MKTQQEKICTGCGKSSLDELGKNSKGEDFLSCCPDSNYVIKQETLEEDMTAREIIMEGNEGYRFRDVIDNLTEEDILDCMEKYAKQQHGFVDGAKEQAKRMYSEEEVMDIILILGKLSFANDNERKEWFEQLLKTINNI